MTLLGLVGDPVGHSLSPAIQGAALRASGLDWEYRLVPVARQRLEAAWPELRRRFLGLNVTIPHKQEAARLADRLSPSASRAGSVNTLCFLPSGVLGDSTDGPGCLAALRRAGVPTPSAALLVGTGGAARALALALALEGAEVRLVGRNREAGARLVAELGEALPVRFLGSAGEALAEGLRGARLLVNATPLGGPGREHECPLPPGLGLDPSLTVMDLVYRPRRTELLRRAEAAGCRCVEGVEMLVEQAALSFSAWTGREAPLGVMREAARRALGEAA